MGRGKCVIWLATDSGRGSTGGMSRPGPSGFFPTGCKPVLAVRTREGHCLRLTADHRVLTAGSCTRYRIGKAWKLAGDLATGDMIVLHDHCAAPSWPGPYSQEQGYLIGLLVGDGALKADKAILSIWKRRAAGNGDVAPDGADGVMAAALAAAKTLPHRADFAGWIPVLGRSEHRLSLAAVKALALDLGMAPGCKVLTPKIEAASSDFTIGFLRGFFDADGSVQGVQEKGVSIRLAQSDLERLRVVQRMLPGSALSPRSTPTAARPKRDPCPTARAAIRRTALARSMNSSSPTRMSAAMRS